MADKHHIYLVPGFFGFANLGDLAYFGHVRDFLLQTLPGLGLDAELHVVKTPPTGSLPKRATRLLETIAETAGHDRGPLHLIGHSSGGLDVRLLVSPGAVLPTSIAIEPFAARVKTVVTVSTPHYGSPVAAFFTSLLGQKLLKVLSLSTMYVLRAGRFPISILIKLGALLSRLDEPTLPVSPGLADEVYSELLGDFSADRQGAISQFLQDVGADQALVLQLAPAGMEVFNASTQDRPQVRYGCVLTQARPPGLGSRVLAGLSPTSQATLTVYDALYRIAASMPAEKLPALSEPLRQALMKGFGPLPTAADNDGVVPTLSQPWGEVLWCAKADHLDAIGHFDDRSHVPPHFDWVSTGTGFNRKDFEALWMRVAQYLVSG